ncbi:DNA repair protein rad5 [Alternaria sp. MG1]|nr:DNA repair protein rad5 [Alternaria sp. MG1]
MLMHGKRSHRRRSLIPISAILYGPKWLSEDLGAFCQDSEIYLQDPVGCDRDVLYYNPHRLSSDDGACCTTFELQRASTNVVVTKLHVSDALDILSIPRVLGEVATPRWLKTELLLHQRQALFFMTKREMGWALEDGACDVWTKLTHDTRALYRNNITGDVRTNEPCSFKGGILADTMGLGKSLSMIALLAHGMDSLDEGGIFTRPTFTSHRDVDTTLLIVPPSPHYISNHQSNTCKAICSLEARSRWAVTGTPLQNRLGDVATLCQFLRVHPYDDRETFHKDIIDPWKAGDNNTAISRLKRLLQCILLRRSKGSVQLPERTDLRHTLQLSEEERQHYATAENNVARSIDAVLGANPNTAFNVTSIIQQINELRLICDLGTYRKPPKPVSLAENNTWNIRVAQRALNALTATNGICCKSCGEIQDGTRYDNSFGTNLYATRLWLFSCFSVACESCMVRNPSTRCSCVRQCPVALVTHAPGTMDSGASSPVEWPSDSQEVLPTKVNALVDDLLKQTPGTKSIVFTFWSSTLDLIEKGLSRASITFTRYDGNTTPTNRSVALTNFRRNPDISVILMTISCAAVGLNITAATRAYIMEPQWNPTVEEQALARVHRMGQTKEVTTIRYVMADTFEERVIETQQRKRELAELLLSTEPHAESEHSLDRLRYFRSLLR